MAELVPVGYGPTDRLFELLPVVVRALDATRGHPLRELLRVLGEQVAVVEDSITVLGDEAFIETCSDWAVPYIGDLVGWTPVADTGLTAMGTAGRELPRGTVLVPRRDVANTIRHRRRKGTLALLEELARDVTGWPGLAVESFRLLAYAQHVEHVRRRGRTADVRQVDELERLGGPFDASAHVVDVRRHGHYNIPGVGLFVWRLNAYSMTAAPAAQAEHVDGPHVYTFDSFYHDVPLFVGREDDDWPPHPESETDVPTPLTRRMLEHRPQRGGPGQPMASPQFYGPGRSLTITAHDWPRRGVTTEIPAEQVRPADLSDWRRYRVRAGTVAVDPELGRMPFRPGQAPSRVTVSYYYGFPADLGGGEYERTIPELPARAVVRFTADQLRDPTTIIVDIRESSREPAAAESETARRRRAALRVIRGHWPPSGVARLTAYDPTHPPDDALIGDLLSALDAAVADPALQQAAGRQPRRGDPLLLANRALVETLFPDMLVTALYVAEPAATGEQLADRLQEWRAKAPRYAVIELTKTDIYDARVSLDLAAGQQVVIRAANRARPTVWLPDRRPDRADSLSATLQPGCHLTLDGLTLTGRAVRLTGVPAADGEDPGCAPTRVTIRHCSLVPGRIPSYDYRDSEPPPPALELADLDGAVIDLSRSVIGAVSVSGQPHHPPLRLTVADSIIDATRAEFEAIGCPGEGVPPIDLTLVRSTVQGTVLVYTVGLVENSILDGELAVTRRHTGCVRFSWVEPGSCTPRRFRCQPDLAVAALRPTPTPSAVEQERTRVRPRFTSTRYGKPGYFQLAVGVAEELRRGADDDSEMGVYHDLYQPQRLANLAARLDEYTPAGMAADLIIVT